jgi:hypothetical protein
MCQKEIKLAVNALICTLMCKEHAKKTAVQATPVRQGAVKNVLVAPTKLSQEVHHVILVMQPILFLHWAP